MTAQSLPREPFGPRLLRAAIQSIGVALFYVVVLVVFSAQSPDFLTLQNFRGITSIAAPLGIVAVGQTIAIVSGGFDLSVGGVLPLSAVTFGLASNQMPFVPALLLAVALGLVVGVVNGVIVQRLKINPFICTLATLSVASGLAYVINNGITAPLTSADAGFWGETAVDRIENSVIAFAAVAVIAALVLRFTAFGRSIYAIGGNREAATFAGVPVGGITVAVYAISGACAGLAGAITSSQLLAAAPTVGADIALTSVAATIVGGAALTGGAGGITGTVLGVLLLGTVSNGLTLLQVSSYFQTILTGLILLLAVGFARLREVLLAVISHPKERSMT